MERISALTGIVFENVTTKDTSWPDILEMLKSGEISMVSELLYTEARKDDYLWSDEPYVSSNYALLSKIDYPNQKMYQVYRSTIGMVSQYGHGDVYRKRFAETGNIVEFENFDQALDALEKDQIDLLMAAEHTLLKQTSYREKTGYKVNLSFNLAADTRFGFNKNEVLLRSIVSKAQRFVDTDTIVKKWTNQVFNYETSFAAERAIYLSIFLAVLFISMMAGMFFYFKGKGLSSTLDKQNVTLYTIFRSIPDMVFCKDINYAYTSCNAGFEEFAGLSESEIIGKTALELFPDRQEMARGIIAMDKKIIHENFTARVEECFIFPDGREKRLEIIKAPLIQNGVTVGLLGISRDITEHKKAVEEAMEASRAKSMFLAHMSHEIRTPMNAIVGMAELNLREEMSPGLYENTLGIKHAGANLLSIINDILDFSKIEAGKLEIISAEYAFVSLVNDVLSIIRMKITEKPLLFTANVDCNTPGKLIGDEARIRQIILNLLSNAVKYTNEGFVSISVSSIINGDTVELTIKVSDSGTGIKEEDIGKLFGDFTQLNNAVGVQGTGLGLAITRSLCYAMGGTVSVSSEFGVGSTFTVILPQKIGGDGKFAQVENPERKDTLVYESRSVYADSIVNSIENLGVRCTLVSTQEEFSEKLSQRKYPFVFIASFLFEDAAYLINSLSFMSKLVLITEFGEPAPDKNIGTLTMPTHSLSIANILNDVTDKAGYDANGKTSMIFAAPTARVLIVDDVGTNLKVAEGLMTPYRMQIDTCKSGAEALKLAARNRYDIIFMDHMMPVMDGIETTAKIRALEDGDGYYEKVPIIALTANAVTGMRDMFIQKGMNDFLAKPIEIPKLNSLLEKWIPKEKRNKYEEEKQANGVFEIEGVDIKTGISLSGGVENYLSALANFHQNGWGKVNEISKCLEGDDIKRYTEQVLALRNAAARIGAGRVSDFARTMEIAGRSEAWAFIRENTEDLLKELRTLLQNIKIALMNTTNRKPDLGGNDMEFLEGRLSKLKAAIEDMDIKSTDTILNELSGKSWDADICTTIENISTCILMSEYDEATSLTAGLLQEIGG